MDNNKEIIDICIDEENDGARLDLALSLQLPEISRSYLQKLIEDGADIAAVMSKAMAYSKK